MTHPEGDPVTPIERCQSAIDALDVAETPGQVRADLERLLCDLQSGVGPRQQEIEPADDTDMVAVG